MFDKCKMFLDGTLHNRQAEGVCLMCFIGHNELCMLNNKEI